MTKTLQQLSPTAVLAATFLVFLGPFLAVQLFPVQLNAVIEKSTYLVFHNTAEFFSIMVSLSVFSVGWYTYDQSRDRQALFLGVAFLVVGLLDFMHTMSNAAMPAFITGNSTNKSTQFWISARLMDASAFLISAYIYPDTHSRWLSKKSLLTAAAVLTGLLFAGIVFFPAVLPATAVQGKGLTPLKRVLEFVVIFLLIGAGAAYWKRMTRTGERLSVYYLAAFIICIFSEAAFASYTTGFDTYNVLGHIYKVAAFYLIYKGIFIASVMAPYVKLTDANTRLQVEIAEREQAEREIRKLSKELEQRVLERTAQLDAANRELEAFASSVSHDLRAPVRAMSGFAKILVEDNADKLDEQAKHYLARIQGGSEKMARLIDDLLRLSRISRQDMNVIEVDLSEKVSSVIAGLREEDPARSVQVRIAPGLKADADPQLIEVALVNLLGNAWKFTSKQREAVIEFGAADFGMRNADCGMKTETKEKTTDTAAHSEIRNPHSKIVYFVKDNGAGFDPLRAGLMFRPFHRLHTDQEFEGTGIGLTIVERVISRHGGKVWAEGEAGKGATVYFTL